ncbi:hypothetical protein [uncultured Winogradskyella sp.]|uniref:hypothetical protein n=1 Tax=uncultured Winogradskyella sp. TaxID=395353 RepID=UPI0026306ED8|nr:hypothetical protein [uncultured Winogradskyella sp.]
MKIKYFFIAILLIFFASTILFYKKQKQFLREQNDEILVLQEKIKENNLKFDNLKLLVTKTQEFDSILSIAIQNKKDSVNKNNETVEAVYISKYNELKRTQKEMEKSISENQENSDSTKEKEKVELEPDTIISKIKKPSVNFETKKIKRIYPYQGNNLVSENDVFIKVDYNPNNDELVNSMTDKPKRIKINGKFMKLISLIEKFDDENRAFYTLLIKLDQNDIKAGLNEIIVIDNISREHKRKFRVIE